MPPPIALVLILAFVGYLLRRDSKEEPRVSSAIWLPVLWLAIIGSRLVSQWFGGGPVSLSQAFEDGNPIDKAVFGALIVAGACVLAQRRVQVGEALRRNPAIVLLILYAGLSVVWSDYPAVSFRRWVKTLGDPVMVLIICTDPFPARAVTAAIKRCGYLLIPLSVLFCRYYPSLGRSFSQFGDNGYTGVTLNKNMLGYLLFVFGLFFTASLIVDLSRPRGEISRGRVNQVINIVLLVMIAWLMSITDSKTALLSLIAGLMVIVACRLETIRRNFWSFALATIVLVVVSDALFSFRSSVVESSGRDLTFTGRTVLWEKLLHEPINPVLGVGYATFWHGERLARYWAMYPDSPPFEAHNGYIEVYLNLGLVGLCLLAWLLWTGLTRMRNRMAPSLVAQQTRHDRLLATFGMGYGVAYLLYNVTEAAFQGLNFLFVIMVALTFDALQVSQPVHARTTPLRAARSNGDAREGRSVGKIRRSAVRNFKTVARPVVKPVERGQTNRFD